MLGEVFVALIIFAIFAYPAAFLCSSLVNAWKVDQSFREAVAELGRPLLAAGLSIFYVAPLGGIAVLAIFWLLNILLGLSDWFVILSLSVLLALGGTVGLILGWKREGIE